MVLPAENFRTVRAHASSGNDLTRLINLLSGDLVSGRSNWVKLTNADSVTADGFDQVTAAASPNQIPHSDVTAIDYLFTKSGW